MLRRRGAPEAGAIFVTVDRLDTTATLYGPAPQSLVAERGTSRLFTSVLNGRPTTEVEERMRREIGFDPDLWWIEIADRDGRSFLELARDEPS